MQSWLMELLFYREYVEWPDLSICQSEDACHVRKGSGRPRRKDIEKMCSDGFLQSTKSTVKYQ